MSFAWRVGHAALALALTLLPLCLLAAEPATHDIHYRVVTLRLDVPSSPDDEHAITEFTQRCTDVLEMYVRRYPELWLWMHRRWRDAPGGENVKGMFPAASSEVADAGEDVEERTQ